MSERRSTWPSSVTRYPRSMNICVAAGTNRFGMVQHLLRGCHSRCGMPRTACRAPGLGGDSSTVALELLAEVVMTIISDTLMEQNGHPPA
jgi:hypothetical protein